jgi:hypothetical protein
VFRQTSNFCQSCSSKIRIPTLIGSHMSESELECSFLLRWIVSNIPFVSGSICRRICVVVRDWAYVFRQHQPSVRVIWIFELYDLSKFTRQRLSSFQIYRIGGGPKAPSSALPVGAQSNVDPIRVGHISISKDLTHAILGVSYASSIEQLLSSNAAGFVYVTEVDMVKRTLTYVAPSPGPLPNNLLLAGSLLWVEQ